MIYACQGTLHVVQATTNSRVDNNVKRYRCFRYLVAGGLVDRVFRHSRALIETDFFVDQDHESPVLSSSYDLLYRICCHLKKSTDQDVGNIHEGNNNVEQTNVESHLLSTLASAEAAGAIGALYAAVALTPQNQKGSSPTPNQITVSQPMRILIVRSLRLLKSIAGLNIQKLQVGTSTYLLSCYCIPFEYPSSIFSSIKFVQVKFALTT